jgi:ornithine cyclodeaminase
MRYLDADALRRALPMAAAIDAMEEAFADDRDVPERVLLGTSLFMPARVGEVTGVKVVSTAPGNPVGLVAVFDATGSPMGLVDGPALTAIRTAAGAGLATRLLAPGDASVLGMLGAGAMAFDQIEAVRAVRPIERVIVWSRSLEHARALADRVGGEVEAEADAAVSASAIVSCATPARQPLFAASAVQPDVHINAVGAFTPEMVEVPAEVVRSAFVVVDDREAAASEAGDLLQAGQEPDATMGDLLAGRMTRRGRPTFFKSVGIGSQDVAAAVWALRAAAERNLGVSL